MRFAIDVRPLGIAVLATLMLTIPAAAQGPREFWTSVITADNKSVERTLSLMLDSEAGQLSGYEMGGPGEGTVPISDASSKEGRILFSVVREYEGQRYVMRYAGKLGVSTISGTCELEGAGQVRKMNWTAKRKL